MFLTADIKSSIESPWNDLSHEQDQLRSPSPVPFLRCACNRANAGGYARLLTVLTPHDDLRDRTQAINKRLRACFRNLIVREFSVITSNVLAQCINARKKVT